MPKLQLELFRWAAGQPAMTGAVILAAGLVYGFFGFRLFRFLLGVTCALLGWMTGCVLGAAGGLPPVAVGLLGALVLGAFSAKCEKPAVALASGTVWGMFTCYLGSQFGLPREVALIGAALVGGLGVFFSLVCYRTMRVVLTAMQGVALMVVGWVSFSTQLCPEIGVTFRAWAAGQALLVPVLMMMLFVTAYSYQVMHQQGDIKTGQ